MKILFIDHPQFTSASFYLWHGLNEILPAGSVVAYPHLPTHYDADRVRFKDLEWFPELEESVERKELPYGIPPFAPGETLLGGDQKETGRYDLAQRFPYPELAPDEISVLEELDAQEYDLVVLANGHRVPTIALGRLVEKAKKMPPLVYLDAGERDELNEHWIHVFRPDLCFKQILTPKVVETGMTVPIPGYTLTLVPLPLSSLVVGREEVGGIPFGKLREMDGPFFKIYDIFYQMGPTWHGRQPLLERLNVFCKEHGLVTEKYATFDQYQKILALSRMAVTMRGSGRDTMRYWEIPLYETLMLADGTMGCIHPYPFEDGKTAVFYRTLSELEDRILKYQLKKGAAEEERRAIARQGKHHLARYHSTAARAVFFLERVEDHLGISDKESERAVAGWKERHGWDNRDWTGPVEGGDL